MRTTFINTLSEIAEKDPRVFLLTGDMGFSVFERFREHFPERFYNIGIAEANMVGVAAGLALTGKTVFIYSIMPFVTMRCYEQIRIDVCYHNLNVKIVGVGGGISYASQGATHHATEDIAIMRALPGMKVICPSDPFEAKEAVKAVIQTPGPAFIRLGKNNEPTLYPDRNEFGLGKGYVIRDGKDISIIATGNMVEAAVKVASTLSDQGIDTRLVSMHTVKPIDEALIKECLRDTKAIFTIEEHNIIGGLGSAVAEVVAEENNAGVLFRRFGIPDIFIKCVGDQQYMRNKLGLDTDQITSRILDYVRSIR